MYGQEENDTASQGQSSGSSGGDPAEESYAE